MRVLIAIDVDGPAFDPPKGEAEVSRILHHAGAVIIAAGFSSIAAHPQPLLDVTGTLAGFMRVEGRR
jgi:hypothetical protein